jgi:putative hydrolase of the HAD superfamily
MFAELWEHFAKPESWRVFDDVEPCLSQLTAVGVGIGIASNFDLRLKAICEGLSALRQAGPVWSSAEIGWRKPAREFFENIEFRLGAPFGRRWMVGDSLELDVIPARDFGWHAVYLDRRPSPAHRPSVDGIRTIRSLDELPALLLS